MKKERATLAGGCFWGMEEIIQKMPGVIETTVGYTGGLTENPTYPQVKTGETGHAEAIDIIFDSEKLRFSDLLDLFFKMHDPTSKNRQGNDIGTQYRSAIFFHDESQKTQAFEAIKRAEASSRWKKAIMTEVVSAQKFYSAEEYHQDYLLKNPGGYSCHYIRD
jgi:methionine-S-sulfoxide reductase